MLPLQFRIALAAALIAALVGIAWGVHHHIYQSGYDDAMGEVRAATAKKDAEYRAKEQQLNSKVSEAQNGLTQANQTISTLSSALAANSRLRDTTNAINAKLSSLPADALRDIARTYGDVFAECRERRNSLATEAEHLNAEKRALVEAWPK